MLLLIVVPAVTAAPVLHFSSFPLFQLAIALMISFTRGPLHCCVFGDGVCECVSVQQKKDGRFDPC